ncbi:hypothetical protein VSDG_03373 [Cytospora chrysosperma]|uniref:Uncharacterized protein n=1 Tax=Cytospora chrysosperma TaxID=252740 RepID=A0A423WB29_CYTCH|nr:hypothetical protein VSDG_03373 [Valsa sordida]
MNKDYCYTTCYQFSYRQSIIHTTLAPREDPLEVSENLQILEYGSKEPTIKRKGPGSKEEPEGSTAQSSDKTKQKQTEEKQDLSTWDPEILAESSLGTRPGIAQFLELRELKKPPGLTFDVSTLSLSMSPDFMRNLHFHKPTHHKTRPWIERAFMQRAVKWAALERVDTDRVKNLQDIKNRTSHQHRGNVFAHPWLIHGAASRVQKHRHEPSFVRWLKNGAPTLPARLYGHLDGIVPEDAEIYVEDHRSYVKGYPDRIASCIWVGINAYWSVSMRACEALAIGNQPHPDWDVLTPVLENFCSWLKETYYNQKEGAHQYRQNIKHHSRQYWPLLRDMMPPGYDIPVVFAFRQKYLLFILKGGIDGELVAQYASHWLPVAEASTCDGEREINELQLARLRDREPEDAVSKTSGGNVEGVKDGPWWVGPSHLEPSLPDQRHKRNGHKIESRGRTKPTPRKGDLSRLSSIDEEIKRLEEYLNEGQVNDSMDGERPAQS